MFMSDWSALMTPQEGHPEQYAYSFVIHILPTSLTSVSIFSVCCDSRYLSRCSVLQLLSLLRKSSYLQNGALVLLHVALFVHIHTLIVQQVYKAPEIIIPAEWCSGSPPCSTCSHPHSHRSAGLRSTCNENSMITSSKLQSPWAFNDN